MTDGHTGDGSLVDAVCRRLTHEPGDVAVLAATEVRRLAPLHSEQEQQRLVADAVARLTGLGELAVHLRDPDVDEVLVNSDGVVWLDRRGRLERVDVLPGGRVEHLLERLLAPLGRRIDRSSPIVDARLPDGARVCAVLPPVAVDGAMLAVRRFADHRRSLDEFTDCPGTDLLDTVIAARCNVVVSGATSSGKTSLVGALLDRLPPAERLVIVEDTAELPVDRSTHSVRLEARPPSADGPPAIEPAALVRTALRLRPDRIIVGEVRGDEVLALVQAMNTGHDGSLSTVHANGPVDALMRLESLVLQAAPTWPLAAIRQQLGRSVDVIVHVGRGVDGGTGSRTIVSIDEVGMPDTDGAPLSTRPLARRDDDGLCVIGALRRRRR